MDIPAKASAHQKRGYCKKGGESRPQTRSRVILVIIVVHTDKDTAKPCGPPSASKGTVACIHTPNLASAAIAIDPAPIKGMPELPLSVLKSGFPVPGNPFNFGRVVSLTEPQFRCGFTNALSEKEARELYSMYAIPGPGRPIFQAATATFNPNSATKVNVTNATRGPLLLIAGADDHTVPPVLVKSALKNYKNSKAVTEYKEFSKRGHSLTIDSGWREIAEYCLNWLKSRGL